MNEVISGVLNGTDIFVRALGWSILLLFCGLVIWWFYLIITLVNSFLKSGLDVTGGQSVIGKSIPPCYRIAEIKGSYKGREVLLGVLFTGFKNEYMPLPHIQMRLKETLGYNINRLPNYATIQKNYLVFKVRLSALWGVFDKSYPPIFSKSYLVIALEKLLATAEDVERGRAVKEIFK